MQATRAPDGSIVPPGGPVSAEPRDCGPAANHCLRGEAYLASGFVDGMRVVFPFEGKWYTFDGTLVDGGTAYPTRPGTAATLQGARLVYRFQSPDVMGEKRVPTSESEALLGKWLVAEVWELDAANGMYKNRDSKMHPIAGTRIGDGAGAKTIER